MRGGSRRGGIVVFVVFVVFYQEALAVAASTILKHSTDTECAVLLLLSSWFQALAVLTKNEFFLWSVGYVKQWKHLSLFQMYCSGLSLWFCSRFCGRTGICCVRTYVRWHCQHHPLNHLVGQLCLLSSLLECWEVVIGQEMTGWLGVTGWLNWYWWSVGLRIPWPEFEPPSGAIEFRNTKWVFPSRKCCIDLLSVCSTPMCMSRIRITTYAR